MSSNTKIVAIIALVYLVIAGSVLGWVVFEVSASGAELENRVALIADKNAQVQAYTELSRLIEETELERQEVRSYVLTEDETSIFLTDIESLGSGAGVELTTRSLEVVEKEGSFSDLLIEFTVEGEELAVKNMLLIFETLPYHSQLTSLTFMRKPGGLVEGTVQLKVTLLNYGE